MSPISTILKETSAYLDDLKTWRRHIHKHPELSFDEHRTSAYVVQCLADMGIKGHVDAMEPGVVAEVDGAGPGPTVALRADLDALPIAEETGLEFASKVTGVSHACGHDMHTAILLGAARYLQSHKDTFGGRVRLLFQPAEEQPPGGARILIERDAMRDVQAILALHVQPELPAGTIGLRSGLMTATINDFDIRIIGRSGHTARPHHAVDPILAATHAIQDMYAVLNRGLDARDPVVLTVGALNAGSTYNVIPSEATLRGTLRCATVEQREAALDFVHRVLDGIDHIWQTTHEITVHDGYPPIINDPLVTEQVLNIGRELLGDHGVHVIDRPSMGAEDFSRFLELAPGCMFRLGVGRHGADNALLHSSHFDPDETAMPVGSALLAGGAIRCLAEFETR